MKKVEQNERSGLKHSDKSVVVRVEGKRLLIGVENSGHQTLGQIGDFATKEKAKLFAQVLSMANVSGKEVCAVCGEKIEASVSPKALSEKEALFAATETIRDLESRTVFAVMAHRWGDTDNHTYLVCVCNSEREALKWAEREEQDRGGKYSCSIWKCGPVTASQEFKMDDGPLVSDSVVRVRQAKVIPEGKTVAQIAAEDLKRDQKLFEFRVVLEECAGVFQNFVEHHKAKGSLEKAQANQNMVDLIRKVLA